MISRKYLEIYEVFIDHQYLLMAWTTKISLDTTGDILGHPYFMFVVHISPFSFLKIVLDVTVLGRLLWTKTTCRSPSVIILSRLLNS